LIPRKKIDCLIRFIPPSQRAWEWDCESVAQSWRRTAATFRHQPIQGPALLLRAFFQRRRDEALIVATVPPPGARRGGLAIEGYNYAIGKDPVDLCVSENQAMAL
jgi:hypothetical protein